jgi:O-methyltransferase involved in polyketide biosynthesis
MPEFDTSQPNIARVYDFLLGGKENFAADRALAEQLLKTNPGMAQFARDNRAFICAAAARAARDGGVRQFLDLGAGLPTHPAVHEAVREVHPDARVAYVDIDPVAVLHAQALLATGDGVAAFQGDLTDPEQILNNPELARVLDLDRPIGVIISGVAHFLPADQMRATVGPYVSRLASGSWLIISCGTVDEGEDENLRRTYTAADTYRHTAAEFASFFDGTGIVPPGVVEAKRWISGIAAVPPASVLYVLCAAGVKP